MLKKYIQIFLETASFQNQQPTSSSYREIAKQVEDQYRIDKEKSANVEDEASSTESNLDIEQYSNLLNYANRNITPSRRFMFTKKPKNRT
jgi:hypothetical protein